MKRRRKEKQRVRLKEVEMRLVVEGPQANTPILWVVYTGVWSERYGGSG